MAPHVPGKLYLEHGPPSSPGAELAPLAEAPAMEIPRGALASGPWVTEPGSWGPFRSHMVQHLPSAALGNMVMDAGVYAYLSCRRISRCPVLSAHQPQRFRL